MRPDARGFKEALDDIMAWEKAADRNLAIDVDI
jgi:hypothetical protein